MYKKKIPFDIDCGIKITMEVIGGKWKSCIIQELCTGPKRPSELHRLFTEASPRVINQQLKGMGWIYLLCCYITTVVSMKGMSPGTGRMRIMRKPGVLF